MDPLAQLRALSGAARRSPLAPQTQIDLMNQGMPKTPAYFLTERMLGQNALPPQVEPVAERSGPMASSPVRQALSAPVAADYSGNRQVVPQVRGPMTPGMTYQRPDYNPGVSGTSSVPAPRRSSPMMQAAGGSYTPEGDLATAVSKMSMTPDPAYVAQARESAQQLGQQRYAQSSEGQAMIGRTQQAQEHYNPAGRPDYNAMSPVQAAMVSQNTYRSGGRAGAMGGMSTVSGAMRDREDAIALAQQAAGPPRPSNGAQIRESRGMMQQAVSGELERMGGQYNPNISLENNARGMSPGTTFTGETSTGVPVIVSRGSAAPLTEDQQLNRDNRNRELRQARAGRMAELGQRRMAQLQQERDSAMDPVNRLAMAAMGDPRAASALGSGIMNSRVGMGQNQVAAEGLQRQIGLDATAEDRAAKLLASQLGVSEAQAKAALADAELKKTQTQTLADVANPDQVSWARGMLDDPTKMTGLGVADRRYLTDLAMGRAPGTVTEAVGGNAPATTEEAIGRLGEIAPQASAALGIDIMTSSPDDIIAEVQSRAGTPAEIKPEDMAVINESIKLRGGVDRKLFNAPGLVSQALGGFFAGPYALPGTSPGDVRSGIIGGIKGGADLTAEAIKAAEEENRKKMEARNRALMYPRMGPG